MRQIDRQPRWKTNGAACLSRGVLVSCLWVAVAMVTAAPAAEAPSFPPPPRLATTAAELTQTKAAPDFAARRDAAAKAGDAILAEPPTLPDGYGSWVFYYACADDGTPLRAVGAAVHECPKCGKRYGDERTLAAYRGIQHTALENAALALGWARACTGDDKYAAGVVRILTKLADDYATYPDRLDRWGHTGILAPLGGRRYVQSLDEAVGVIRLAKAYDLTRDAPAWSDAARRHVEADFFRPTADTLLRFNQDINNHQTWYDAGLMAIASVLGDAALVDRVLTMRGGYDDQLRRSLGDDGLWYEGTLSYHNYALQAMFEIADAGRRMGLPLHERPRLRAMIEGPLRVTYPDGRFPAFNDGDPGDIRMFAGAFEWAWRTYHDPRFAQAAAFGDPAKLRALLGADAKPETPLSTRTEVLSDAGLAILREGAGADAACVFLKYGPHGGDHGHFDKLGIVLYAGGREWLLDPGRLTYSHKEYKTWVKETAAHNTVALGGNSQAATTGKLLWLKQGEGWSGCAAESDGAYPGAVLRRSLVLTPQMLVDVFDVRAPELTQVDDLVHAVADEVAPAGAAAATRPAEAAPLGPSDGFQHLTEVRRWGGGDGAAQPWDFALRAPGSPRLRVWLAGADLERFTASGIGYTIEQRTPTLVRRRLASQPRFVTVYDLSARGDGVRGVEAAEGAGSVRVSTSRGAWTFELKDSSPRVTPPTPPPAGG